MKFKTYKFLLLKSFTVIHVTQYAVQSDSAESLKMPEDFTAKEEDKDKDLMSWNEDHTVKLFHLG